MKKIFRSVAALAVVMFAGCTTDMTDDIMAPAAGGSTTITVGFDETKTSLGELVDGTRKVYWSAGDKIAVNGITSAEAVINEENKGVAEFTFEGTLTAPYSALYPAEAYVDAQTINLAANQGRGLENVAANALPMAGYSTSEEFTVLHHLAGAFRFRIKKSANEDADAHVIHHVELRGNNGEQLSGNFAIDYASATLTGTSTDEADKVAYSLVNKASVTESEMNVFVIVPAGTYEQGITLRIVDAAGHYMDVKATTSQTINKGEIKAMPVVELVPTGTLINVEIKSAGDLLAFAQDYNAGKYFNVSPFVVEVTEDIVFDDATSAAWEPIGCEYAEGTEEYNKFGATNYFNGEFEGNGHSIKNWVTSKPLFAFSGSNGSIRNLTIDSSCTVTPTFASNPDGQFATLVGYHKGLITNCHNNANITISGEWSANARIGGVAGRIVGGEINGCTVNGDLTVDNGFTTTGSAYIGGVLGASTNTESVVKDSHFRGNLSFQGAVTKSGGYYFIGGIVGMFRGKSLTNCTTQKENGAASINVSPVATAYTDGLVGGIVGQADAGEIKGCANYATIDYAINTTDYTQLGVGGVIGENRVSLTNVTNNGEINVYPTEKTILCHNVYLGGVAGMSHTGTYSPEIIVIDNVTNNGVALFSGHKSTVEGDGIQHNWILVGGIVGYDYKGTCNHIQNSTNNALVGVSFAAKQNGRGTAVGGIVGLLYQNASKIESCINNGYICNCNFNNTNNKTNVNAGGGAFAGGIVGYAAGQSGSPVVIDKCQSTCATAPASNPARVYSGVWANTGIGGTRGHNGGIAGLASIATVSNCTSSAVVYQHQQGYPGGLVAWMASSTLEKCTMNAKELKLGSSVVSAGGLVGYATSSTIKENVFNSALNGTAATADGVLIGTADANTSITDNSIKGTHHGAAITLDSKMVGSGAPSISGTTLLE